VHAEISTPEPVCARACQTTSFCCLGKRKIHKCAEEAPSFSIASWAMTAFACSQFPVFTLCMRFTAKLASAHELGSLRTRSRDEQRCQNVPE
jgi:hypothetical protein